MLTERNMNSMTKVCGIPIRIINMIYEMPNISQQDKDFVEKYDRKFNFYDIATLYFITMAMIANNIVLLFLINNIDSKKSYNVVSGECYYLIGFGIVLLMVRIWNDKFYMLEPILNHWKVPKPNRGINKLMFLFAIVMGLASIGTMMAVVSLISNNKMIEGIILTAVTYALFILCSFFYRVHTGTYIYHAIKVQNQQPLSPSNPTLVVQIPNNEAVGTGISTNLPATNYGNHQEMANVSYYVPH